MVARARRDARFWAVAVVFGLSGACGQASSSEGTGNPANGGAKGTVNSAQAAGFSAVAGAGPHAEPISGADCARRRAADCSGIKSSYHSDRDVFGEAPELAACSEFVSFDGCGKLVYSFDDQGCAFRVEPGPDGWQPSSHLSPLRDCLTEIFEDASFACLASRSLRFDESCFLR
jgi:hypothetical protein